MIMNGTSCLNTSSQTRTSLLVYFTTTENAPKMSDSQEPSPRPIGWAIVLAVAILAIAAVLITWIVMRSSGPSEAEQVTGSQIVEGSNSFTPSGNSSSTPQPNTAHGGSSERERILDALRSKIQEDPGLRGPIEFYDVTLRTTGSWAFVATGPKRPGGNEIRGWCFDGDEIIHALLRQQSNRWEVVDWGGCATDVWYVGWPEQYGVPHSLIGVPDSPSRPPPQRSYPYTAFVNSPGDGFLSLRSQPSVRGGDRILRMNHGNQVTVLSCRSEQAVIDAGWAGPLTDF